MTRIDKNRISHRHSISRPSIRERGLRRKGHTLLDAFRSFSFAHAHIRKITVYSEGTENRRKRYVKNVSVIPCDIPI